MARLARLLLLMISVVAMSPFLRAQLVNVELLGSSLTAPVNGALSDVDLLSGGGDGFNNLLGVEVLGDSALLGVSLSGQDILLLGAPVADDPAGGALAPLLGIGDSQGAVLEFLQDTASGGNVDPTVLTIELPGASDGSGNSFDNSKDRVPSSKADSLGGVSKAGAYRCIDKDHDSVCDSQDQCPNSPANVMVLPSGCHLDMTAPLELHGVTFAVDTALLTTSSVATLRQAARILKENPKLKFEISGHTDDLGSERYNQRLSERRADAVKNYFLAEGVPVGILVVTGYGESRPLISVDGLAGQALADARARNRRVELVVIKNKAQY